MNRLLVLMLALTAFAAFLVGCPSPTPEQTPTTGGVGETSLPENDAALPPTSDDTSADVPTDLTGELVVAVPCGVAMAYQKIRDIVREANPDLKFVDHVKNIAPMVREMLAGKGTVDVFLSLGDKEVERLVAQDKVDGDPVPFMRQGMLLAVQLDNPLGIESLEDLARDDVKTIAVCDAKLSIGFYGQKALESVGVWDELVAADKIVRPDQPIKAKNLVIGKQADAAFVYAACADETWQDKAKELSIAGKADVVMAIPEDLYGGMNAVAVVAKSANNLESAKKFVQFLTTPAAQEAVSEAGYGRVDEESAQADEVALAEDCDDNIGG